MDLGLKGKSVMVCASSEGIALAAAKRFAAEGARVAMCSRDRGKLDRAAEFVRAAGPDRATEVLAEALDVTDEPAVERFVAAATERFGGVDVCVTNAGGPPAKMFLETTPEEWDRAYALNLKSTVLFARAVLPSMRERRWGRIVTITSVSVRQPVSDLVYSNTVRAAVMGLVKSLSNEFGKDGITVNNVGPGYTATERLRGLVRSRSAAAGVSEEAYLGTLGEQAALRRVGEPEEVADAIVWLASERASYITGQTIAGGWRGGTRACRWWASDLR